MFWEENFRYNNYVFLSNILFLYNQPLVATRFRSGFCLTKSTMWRHSSTIFHYLYKYISVKLSVTIHHLNKYLASFFLVPQQMFRVNASVNFYCYSSLQSGRKSEKAGDHLFPIARYSRTPVERPPSPATIPLIRPYFV